MPTLYQWVRWNEGLRRTLCPFKHGHFLSTGAAEKVLEEAGLHGKGQLKAISDYAKMIEKMNLFWKAVKNVKKGKLKKKK
jgi:hypothetical protein